MKRLLLLCAALLAAALPAQDARYNEFVAKAGKAIDYDDDSGLDRAIKSDPELALQYFAATCWDLRATNDEKSNGIVQALKASWKRTFGTLTLEKYERYVVSRTESDRKALFQAENEERKVWDAFREAQRTGDREAFVAAFESAKAVARKFQELGHALFAARAWGLAGQIGNSIPQRTLAERRQTVECIQNFVRQRDLWEWNTDAYYLNNKVWAKSEQDKLNELEGIEPAGASNGRGGVAAAVDADKLVKAGATEEIVALEFKVAQKPHDDLFMLGGPIPTLWMSAEVEGKGPSTNHPFPLMTPELYLVRPSPSKFGVTTDITTADLDKNRWQEIDPSTRYNPTLFYLGENQTRPYAMWFYVPGQQEPLFGLNHNLEPQPETARIYYKSAASWEATIAGERVTFYDDNANGELFDDPSEVGIADRTRGDPGRGTPVPAYDSMQIGKGVIQPISSYVEIDDQWYHLRKHDGEELQVGVRPLDPEVFEAGTIELDWKGPRSLKPEVLVLQGTGGLSEARYNIAGKAQEVPAGAYEIGFGRIVTGKGARAQQAHVFNGSSEPIIVKPGETTEVTLGAPFVLDFDREGSGDRVDVDSSTIRVVGTRGEVYGRITVPLEPEVLVSTNESGKGARPVGEFEAMDLDNLNAAASAFGMGIEAGFYPVPKDEREGKTVLQLRLPSEDSVVGLRQKRHKMFGRLEPVYK